MENLNQILSFDEQVAAALKAQRQRREALADQIWQTMVPQILQEAQTKQQT